MSLFWAWIRKQYSEHLPSLSNGKPILLYPLQSTKFYFYRDLPVWKRASKNSKNLLPSKVLLVTFKKNKTGHNIHTLPTLNQQYHTMREALQKCKGQPCPRACCADMYQCFCGCYVCKVVMPFAGCGFFLFFVLVLTALIWLHSTVLTWYPIFSGIVGPRE